MTLPIFESTDPNVLIACLTILVAAVIYGT